VKLLIESWLTRISCFSIMAAGVYVAWSDSTTDQWWFIAGTAVIVAVVLPMMHHTNKRP
jgi:hypothetical protein